MRILRGKSNLEVSSQGFAWFVVGLVLATFVGGAVRTILSSDRVHQRIVTELRHHFPQHQFEIGNTEVLLSQGLWPGLGLRLRHLTFNQDVCGKLSFRLTVPEAVLPVDLLALRNGKVRLGQIELNKGHIHFNYRACAPNPNEVSEPTSSTVGTTPAIVAPRLDWEKVGEQLDGLELKNFTLTYERNVTWKILVPQMEVDLDDDLEIHGMMIVQKSLPFGALSHAVEIEAEGDDKVLQLAIHSEFKEGTVNLKGTLDLNNNSAVAQLHARQLPLKDLMSELHQMGFIERDVQLKTTWLSCGIKWEGPLANPAASPVQVADCKVEGGYGRIDLGRAEVSLDEPTTLNTEAVLKVTKLQMQPVLEALGRQVLPRVLARPGFWSGELLYLHPKSWSLDGHLENVEVNFSHRSVRGKQVADRLRTRIKRQATRIDAVVDEVQIRGGDFFGQLHFSLEEDWRNGDFRADIDKLRFSPSIQNLLLGGNMGDLKFSGKGSLKDGELQRWEGESSLERVTGSGWSLEGVQVGSRFSEGVFHLDGRAKRAQIHPAWYAYSELQKIRPDSEGSVGWKDIAARVDILSHGGIVHAVTAMDQELNQTWRLKGSWVRDGEFNAILNIGAGKEKSYTLSGEKGRLRVQDSLR